MINRQRHQGSTHPYLRPASHRQTRMQCPLIPRTILQQILPEHRIADHRPKRNAVLPRLITINEFTPPLVPRRRHHREISAAARNIVRRGHVREERAQPVTAQRGRRVRRVRVPVRVEVVPLADAVLDQLHGLQVRARHVEPLEQQRALLDAADHGVARHVGRLRGPRLPEALGAGGVGDG